MSDHGANDVKERASAAEIDAARREFLRNIGTASVVSLGAGLMLYTVGVGDAEAQARIEPEIGPLDPRRRWGMLIDTGKCVSGCEKCVEACKKENGWQARPGSPTDPQWIRKVDVKDPKGGFMASLPVMCQHCANPPCVDVCPTGASMKRADGIVLVDKHICIGCRYCMMACPYKARSFIHEHLPEEGKRFHAPTGIGTVESCTMCVHRVDRGQIPACVEACDKGAMLFGDLNDPNSEIARRIARIPTYQIRADLGTDNGVRYTRLP